LIPQKHRCRVLDRASERITIRKMPQVSFIRREFGKTNSVLNIVHPPVIEDAEDCDE